MPNIKQIDPMVSKQTSSLNENILNLEEKYNGILPS